MLTERPPYIGSLCSTSLYGVIDMLRWTALILMMLLAACAETGTGASSDPADTTDPSSVDSDPADTESDASDVSDLSLIHI